MLRSIVAILLGRLAGRVSRLLGRGGTAVPGLIAEKIAPRLVERLTSELQVAVVTGTNGKTTTTKMLAGILTQAGHSVLTNRTGSNLSRGIATALIQEASLWGRIDADVAVFEVDEAAVRSLGPRLAPGVTVVTNLARDQLDRYGELATTAEHVAAAVAGSSRAVLNADDPMVAGTAGAAPVTWFGAAPGIRATMPHDGVLYGDDGPGAPAAAADFLLVSAEPEGDRQRIAIRAAAGEIVLRLAVPGAYNGYNAAAAVAAATSMGATAADCTRALESMPPAFGRGQFVDFKGRRVRLLLVKNPAGLNQAIRLLTASPPGQALVCINDNDADGRDVSWLWDAAVEDLAESGHRFGTSGTRADDMALRLKYAGIDAWSEPDLGAALDRAVAAAGPGETVQVVPTYTAMLVLVDRLLPDVARAEAWQ